MFAKKRNKGIVTAGLVAASVMMFLRDPILAIVGDVLSGSMSVDISDMQTRLLILGTFYLLAGLVMATRGAQATSIAFSAAMWTIGLAAFWLIYAYTLGPIIQGFDSPVEASADVWQVNIGSEAMSLLAVVGAFFGKLRPVK